MKREPKMVSEPSTEREPIRSSASAGGRASTALPPSAPSPKQPERLIKRAVVLDRVGDVRAETLWRWIKAGTFPKPVRLPSSTLIVWRESEINAWIDARVKGMGWRPDAAIAERNRRRANKKAAPPPRIRFVRRAP
jgi:predicted DNA-binding transcriptional regulator AlpA